MKVQPVKMQGGGGVPPFVHYMPLPRVGSPAPQQVMPQNANAEGEKEQGLFDDYTVKQLVEYGLPNDVDSFLTEASFANPSQANNPYRRDNIKGLSKNTYQLYSKLNKIRFNKEKYDSALNNAIKNGATQELALTTTGKLIAYNSDGELTNVSTSEYNPEEYQALTVGELAQLRANNPNLAFDTSTLDIINSSIGRDQIFSKIENSIKNLQSDSFTQDTLLNSLNAEDLKTLQALSGGGGPEGIYKITSANEGLSEPKVKKAINNIYRSLSTNEKHLLSAVAAQNGLDPKDGALQIIFDTIQTNTGSETSTKIDYDSTATKALGLAGVGGNDGKGLTSTSQAAAIINGNSVLDKPVTITTGTASRFDVPKAAHWNKLNTLKDDTPISASSLFDAINGSVLGTAGDTNSIYMGEQKIDMGDAGMMAFIGNSGLTQAFLPYKQVGNQTMINYDILDRIDEAKKEISEKDIKFPQEARQIYKSHQVGEYYDALENPEAAYRQGLLKPFFLIDAMTTSDYADGDTTFGEVIESSAFKNSSNYNRAKRDYAQAIAGGDLKQLNKKTDIEGGFWLYDRDIIKGTVAIPVSPDYITTYAASGDLQGKKSDYETSYVTDQGRRVNESLTPVINNFPSQE